MKKTRISFLVFIVSCLLFSMTMYGCNGGGGDGPTSPSAVDVTGTWSGTYSTSLVPQSQMTLQLTQSGASVTGTYGSPNGATGTVSGTLSGNTVNFTLNQTTAGCTGTFSGTATVSGNSMTFTFTGSDCLGTHANGQGNVTK